MPSKVFITSKSEDEMKNLNVPVLTTWCADVAVFMASMN